MAAEANSAGDKKRPLEQEEGTAAQTLGTWVGALGSKCPTPGGGAAAAVAAALGAASGAMAAIYTTRKKDEESGVAEEARALASRLQCAASKCLTAADEDAAAYAALQSTWKKDCSLSEEEKSKISAEALDCPSRLLKICIDEAEAVAAFLPRCNPNITSDAKVSIHLLAGAARAAFQTVLVNKPSEEIKTSLKLLLDKLAALESEILK
eukprot:TRINITY_DN72675_c0_g1_i1.p1 TRINITY_DN72675_c0_g1~~TRINITY_DN72675_c0_g1_i1.p1  ORF type:complete len:222 (-),score=60.76 TRINITY_DN72675_c0_g1_i1:146-772(-)